VRGATGGEGWWRGVELELESPKLIIIIEKSGSK